VVNQNLSGFRQASGFWEVPVIRNFAILMNHTILQEFEIPDTPSRVQTGVANLTFSSPIPSLSSESLMLISGSGDDGSAESSLQPLFNDDVAMPALDFDGEPFDQFLSGMESDPCDFMCMASSSHTHTSDLFQVNGFQDDVADHRLSEQ